MITRLDTAHASIWLCRFALLHARFPYDVSHRTDNGEGDDQEFAEGKDITLQCTWQPFTVDLWCIRVSHGLLTSFDGKSMSDSACKLASLTYL
jgi:hypothetical protein